MTTNVPGWTTLAEQPLVLLREYSFGSGDANALAVQLPDRKLLLVSAPRGTPASELAQLRAHGEVVALLAINGAHHLGLAECRRAFPNAQTYAAPSARARIIKKGADPGALLPIEQLRALLGDRVDVLVADGCKIGDLLVRVRTEHGPLLYLGDFVANIPKLPNNLLFKLMFKLTDSGPGFKVFRIFFNFFVADKSALRAFLIREVESQAPAIVVPGHGEVVARPDVASTLLSMLRAI